jgi:hypothetical protein
MSQGVTETKPERGRGNWKQRFAREFIGYWTNVLYLVFFFGVFAWYRRFVLAEYQITYLHYGTAIIEALILAKVILIGDALGLNRGDENKPLIYPTVRKAIVFSIFVGIFAVVEHVTEALLHGKGVAAGLASLWSEGRDEILARCLVTFFAFIPFFAFRELAIQLGGEGKLQRLFFRRKTAAGAGEA